MATHTCVTVYLTHTVYRTDFDDPSLPAVQEFREPIVTMWVLDCEDKSGMEAEENLRIAFPMLAADPDYKFIPEMTPGENRYPKLKEGA